MHMRNKNFKAKQKRTGEHSLFNKWKKGRTMSFRWQPYNKTEKEKKIT